MGTLTTDVPLLPEHCPHKLPASCRLTSTPLCCACYDRRPHSSTYRVYIDGVGFVSRGSRWQSYCWFCKTFWDNRVADAGVDLSRTRIPEAPDQTEWLERWYEWHKGERIVPRADGSREVVRLNGEPLREVDPGLLPRTLNELRGERFGFAEQRSATARHPVEQEQMPDPSGPSLDETLDQLLDEAEAEEVTASSAAQETTPAAARWNPFNNRFEPAAQRTTPSGFMSDMNTMSDRIREAKESLQLARERRDRLSQQLEEADTTVRAKHERVRRLERDRRRIENFARVFGTREEIERQGDAYESPIGGMFTRAMGRYRQAEEARQQAQELGERLDRMEVPASVEIGGVWGDQLRIHLGNSSVSDSSAELQAASGRQPQQLRPDYPHSQLLQDQMAILQQLSGDSARIRSELSAIRQLSTNTPPTSNPTSASTSAYVSALTQTAASAGAAPLEMISSGQQHPSSLAENEGTREETQADTTMRLISQLRSAAAEAEVLVSAINSFDRIRETSLAPASDQSLGLDVDSDRPAPKTEEEMVAKLACRVCYTQIADVALLPCGHLALCKWCADMAVPGRENDWTQPQRGVAAKCPVCRVKVKRRARIYAVTQD